MQTFRFWSGLPVAVALGLALFQPGRAQADDAPAKKLLVVTVTKGYHHASIPTGEKVLADLGAKSGAFTVDYVRTDQDMAQKMTPAALQAYDGVIFESTTGDLPLPDKAAFLDWIKSGKAFIGMHAATDTFHSKGAQVDPYIEMIGGEFDHHGPQVTVECLNQDPSHPATKDIGNSWSVHDEIYQMKNFSRADVHMLLALDKHPNTGAPGYYPVAWCKMYGQGRVFYTSLGHRDDVWQNPVYQQHILGGIKWALGLVEGSAAPQAAAGADQPASLSHKVLQ
jgi:type 1 glutamine amidotransferase